MEKPSISFFVTGFILLFALISFILVVFDLHRLAFVFELMLLLIFIFLLAFAMFVVYHNKKWGWTILGATLIILLLNLFFVFLLTRTFETIHITTMLFSVAGLVVALLNLRGTAKEPDESYSDMQHEKSKDYYPYIDKMEPQEAAVERPNIEKTFVPGKFVASKKANKFHVAKCDWAKRISSQNQLWFNSEQEAKAHGFEADQCVA